MQTSVPFSEFLSFVLHLDILLGCAHTVSPLHWVTNKTTFRNRQLKRALEENDNITTVSVIHKQRTLFEKLELRKFKM